MLQAMSEATEHMLSSVWVSGGIRDVYADYNDLTLSITTNALFGVDMSSSQSAGISSKLASRCCITKVMLTNWVCHPHSLAMVSVHVKTVVCSLHSSPTELHSCTSQLPAASDQQLLYCCTWHMQVWYMCQQHE